MNRCKICGWENQDDKRNCGKCGAELTLVHPVGVGGRVQAGADYYGDEDRSCPKCGYQVRKTELTCPNCGSTLNRNVGTLPETPTVDDNYSELQPTIDVDQVAVDRATLIDIDNRKLVGLLLSYSINPSGALYPVYEGRNIYGRKVGGVTAIEGDGKISAKHLSILYRVVDKKFKFKDLESSLGTVVNGELLDEGELHNNDVITLGDTKLLFVAFPDF